MQSRTLGSLILAYELVFILLLLLTGVLVWQTTSFWYDNSKELSRLNQLLHHNEQIRSALTRQLHFMLRASVMDDDMAITSYNKNSRILDRLFGASFRLTENRQEDQAINKLQQQYRMVQVDMNKIRHTRQGHPLTTIRMLDPDYAARITSVFDEYHRVWRELLINQSEAVTEQLESWLRTTLFLYALLLLLAIMLLLFTRRTIRKQFVVPMQALTNGATIASGGDLEHRVPIQGTAETRQLGQALNVMSEQLATGRNLRIQQERQAALGALVPVVAHNIRNPLAGIRATVQLFDEHTEVQEINEHKKAIIDTIDRLGRWVSTLLSYLHPLQPRYRKCAAASLLQGLGNTLRISPKHGVTLQTGRMDENLLVLADPDLIEQALYSLISNAIDASPQNGTVLLEIFREGKYAVIRILDHGPGIPFTPDNEELVPGRSTKRFGTGLGLPIAMKICSSHGWSLHFLKPEKHGADIDSGTDVRILAPLHTADTDVANEHGDGTTA
ncbi:MAG: ATP-binding protein [Candidatus Porifericomitaceae bacterium WSBS_2022_MAG_OTU9]